MQTMKGGRVGGQGILRISRRAEVDPERSRLGPINGDQRQLQTLDTSLVNSLLYHSIIIEAHQIKCQIAKMSCAVMTS